MDVKVWLYTKVVGYLDVVKGYLLTQLRGHYLQKNIEHADAFLAKYRTRLQRLGFGYSSQKRAELNPDCTHLKGSGGGTTKFGTRYKDYNVHKHTFPDNKIKIWCGYNCGFVSRPFDSNWKEALNMMAQSSNHPSSSEIIFAGVKNANPVIVTVQDEGIPNGKNASN